MPRLTTSQLTFLTICAGFSASFATAAKAQDALAPAPTDAAPIEPAAAPATPPPTDAPPTTPVEEAPPPAAAKPKPPPYSLPWQLRPIAPANVVRLDSSYGFYKNPKNDASGSALVSTLLGSYKVTSDLGLIARVGLVSNSPPDSTPPVSSATSFLNPVLAGLYGVKLSPSFKLGLFLGVTVPIGSGGGTNPDAGKAAANSAGISTRSAFDNAMFAVDYLTVFPGVGLAYVQNGLTVQAEATVFKLTKVRGPGTEDDSKVNFTTGLHVGYFILPMLSVGVEIRHQRWLSTPANVAKDTTGSVRDTTTFAFGPRLHFKLSDSMWFRPGVSLSLPIDDPMKKAEYKIVQLDLPLSF